MGKRFHKSDWLAFGLAQLAADGPQALRVQELCKAANKTIGSFYHHFDDQAAFVDALMEHWRETHTLPILDALEAIDDNDARARELTDLASTLDVQTEIGIRLLASQNKRANAILEDVDHQRMSYVAKMYAARFEVSAEEASDLARLEYAAFVGSQMIFKAKFGNHAPTLSLLLQRLVSATMAPLREDDGDLSQRA